MQKQQNSQHILCNTCREFIPKGNIDIHTVRCNMKKQSSSLDKVSNFIGLKRPKKPKIFHQKQKEPQKQHQEKIPCPLCGYMQTFMELDTHPSKCPGQQSVCEFCGDSYPTQLLQEHQELCQSNQHANNSNFQEESSFQSNAFSRFTQLMEMINQFQALMQEMQLESQGLTQQDMASLKQFHYKASKQQDLCTICYCRFQQNEQCLQLKCKHIYHRQCISKWLQKSSKCPLCKHDQKQSK